MAVKSVLAMKVNGTTGCYRLIGATATQIGSNFGAAEVLSKLHGPGAVQFSYGAGGSKCLIVAFVNGVPYSFDGFAWATNSLSVGYLDNPHSGLFVAYPAGIPTVCLHYRDNGVGFSRGATSTDGVNWTVSSGLSHTIDGNPVTARIVFKNVLYMIDTLTGYAGHYSWDPATNAVTIDNTATCADTGACFFEFGGALYKVQGYTSTPGMWIWSFNGTTWTPIVQLPNTGNATPTNKAMTGTPATGTPIAWDYGDGTVRVIYLTTNAGGNYGWLAAKITGLTPSTGSASDISSAVLPAGWAYGASPMIPVTSQFRGMSELESNPAAPTFHIWQADSNSTSNVWNYYPYHDDSTLIGNAGAPTDTGGEASMTLPLSFTGGSEYIWEPSDFDVRIISTVPTSNGRIINFMAFGPLGTELKSAALFLDASDGQPAVQATLGTPVTVLQTTIAVASNGVNVNTFAGAGTLHATDTTGFPGKGTLRVATGSGTQTVTYTGISGNDFTGCTSSGAGVMATNGSIKAGSSPNPTLNVNNIQIDGVTCDGNTATPTIYSMVWEAQTDGISTAQRVRVMPGIF